MFEKLLHFHLHFVNYAVLRTYATTLAGFRENWSTQLTTVWLLSNPIMPF